ncbi:MAG: tetratricopeptide repeat protein, partial [Aphanocapsa feldmannii 288cV]
MELSLPSAYLVGLVGLLGVVAVFVTIQVVNVRRDEGKLSRLQQEIAEDADPVKLYELGSVQLRKRLYGQAADTLRQAALLAGNEPVEGQALIHNALGFSLAAQKKFVEAETQYRQALRCKADYPVALNNLGFALERQQRRDEAADTYRRVLGL